MAVRKLNIDFDPHQPNLEIVGRREVLSKTVEGSWATSFKGQGMEFTGYRAYTYSDDASLIDWRASLRAKETLVREFEEFKNFKVVFLLDVSDTMLFTTTEKLKAEYGAELIYTLSQSASRAGDAIGLAMYSDRLVASVEPSFGKGIRYQFQRQLANTENYGGKKDFKKSLLELNSILSDQAIIIIVSDFLSLPDDWEQYMSLLSIRHHLMGVMLKDRRDRDLSDVSGQFMLRDPDLPESKYVDVKHYQKEYKHQAEAHEMYVRNVFKKLHSDCTLIINGESYEKSLTRFFEQLARKSG
ncbi:MAG: DUF58 domain-containing protein [Candidatus Woesearchaeota archaeon]